MQLKFLQSKYQALKAAISLAHFLDNISIQKGAVCIKNRMWHIKPLVHFVQAGKKLLKKAILIILAFLLATWSLHSRGIQHSEGWVLGSKVLMYHHKHCSICRSPSLTYEEIRTTKCSSTGGAQRIPDSCFTSSS